MNKLVFKILQGRCSCRYTNRVMWAT